MLGWPAASTYCVAMLARDLELVLQLGAAHEAALAVADSHGVDVAGARSWHSQGLRLLATRVRTRRL